MRHADGEPLAVRVFEGNTADPQTIRDAMWMWGHYEGSYDGAWGLPGDSPITPVEAGTTRPVRTPSLAAAARESASAD